MRPCTISKVRLEPLAGSSIDEVYAAAQDVFLALKSFCVRRVVFKFNGIVVVVRPDTTKIDMLDLYVARLRRRNRPGR